MSREGRRRRGGKKFFAGDGAAGVTTYWIFFSSSSSRNSSRLDMEEREKAPSLLFIRIFPPPSFPWPSSSSILTCEKKERFARAPSNSSEYPSEGKISSGKSDKKEKGRGGDLMRQYTFTCFSKRRDCLAGWRPIEEASFFFLSLSYTPAGKEGKRGEKGMENIHPRPKKIFFLSSPQGGSSNVGEEEDEEM